MINYLNNSYGNPNFGENYSNDGLCNPPVTTQYLYTGIGAVWQAPQDFISLCVEPRNSFADLFVLYWYEPAENDLV